MTKWQLHSISPSVPFFKGSTSGNITPARLKKSLKFYEKNRQKIVNKKKIMQYKKNPLYIAGKGNFDNTFTIPDRSVKICSSYVSGHFKKSGFEKNTFKF